jgi:pSer/pThr/pTyr-binding forkhead associated (FHA) protein
MPYLQLQDRKIPLPDGESIIGAGDGATVRLPGHDGTATAIVTVAPLGRTIRRGRPDAVFTVNGVPVGAEPVPLLHGDRIVISGEELRFGQETQAGSTMVVSSVDAASALAGRAGRPHQPTTVTGGRVISLVDGREYEIPPAGLVFGRAADTDVVIHSDDASRRHARITPEATGYVLHDESTNGCWVNGERVAGMRRLGRADVVRMAGEEFRFYADAATAASVPESVSALVPVAVAPERADGALATLDWTAAGPLRGARFSLLAEVTHLGRAESNDLAILETALADRHATLERRADGWVVVDGGSDVGTYVDGDRVVGERRLTGPAVLQMASVVLAFTPWGG